MPLHNKAHRGSRWTVSAVLLAASTLGPVPLRADTLEVPGEYSTICEASSVASYGDTVLVAPGVHEYRQTECGPIRDGIVITSEDGPEVTILNVWTWGPFAGSLMYFESGAGPTTELSGFTILYFDVSGYPVPAVILCYGGASPKILRNVIRPHPDWPLAGYYTVVIDCIGPGGTPLIASNSILGGSERESSIGIISADGGVPVVERNIFFSLSAGLSCVDSSPASSCNLFWDVEIPYYFCSPGERDIFEDPFFCRAQAFDFSLRADSPAAHGYGCGLVGALSIACESTATTHGTWGGTKHIFR